MGDRDLEEQLAREAAAAGYELRRDRRRGERAVPFGGFMLVDPASSRSPVGGSPFRYCATLGEIAAYLAAQPAAKAEGSSAS